GTAAVPRMPRGAAPSFDPARDAGAPSGGGVRPPPIDLVGQLRSLTMLQWNPSATARPGEPEAPPVAPDQPAAPPNRPAGAAPVRDVPAPREEATPPEPARSRPEALPVPAPVQMPVPALTQPPPVAIDAPERGLFGVAAAPFVQGDFVAALRLDEDRWAIVQPAAEAFPNVWQRRLILWFAIAFAIVAPVGWLFARRLSKPLGQFAVVAERLGRDPAASVVAVGGPAELGRATHAFNLMQTRLRAFVADRTAMIGAISHDLRTPLTRMRFRIEDVPDELREGLLEEVEEMEGMITSVLEFIRDASSPGLRERIDLRTLVEDVVEDAVLVGNDVAVAEVRPAIVDVDVLGMRRVLNNLLENAIKYGGRARVRLVTDDGCAIAEIIDAGPGLPEYEIERVFEPFYRSESARSSDKSGHGLGLAVCRSIARAHGGDVRFIRSSDGFRAQVRLPLAYSTS
ncbi:MAG: sensor histidine kinase, partial [Sphingomonas bacterium]